MFQDFRRRTVPETGPARLDRLRAAMAEAGVDAFLVPRADAHQGETVPPRDERLAWLTSFTGSAGIAAITAARAIVFVDGRYRLQVAAETDPAAFERGRIPEESLADWLGAALPAEATVGFDPWLHTLAEIEEIAARPEMKYMPAAVREQWQRGAQQFRGPDFDAARARRFVELRRKLIRALRDAGAGLLLGADAPQVFNVPGFATLRELESLVAAGLTPWQALSAGTRNPAIALGVPESFGTVEVGRRADLLLLDADPLADIRNVWKRAGVVAGGRYLSASELDAKLAEFAKAP